MQFPTHRQSRPKSAQHQTRPHAYDYKQAQFSSRSSKDLKTRYNHGGRLRSLRAGRGFRPINTRDPLHIVFKCNSRLLRTRSLRTHQNFREIQKIFKRYSQRFHIGIEQISIQRDHIHLLIRTLRRALLLNFLRVSAGQIAQRFQTLKFMVTDTPEVTARRKAQKAKFWIFRPFSRLVKGLRGYRIVRNYIQLNEKEALGQIPYRKERLRGLTSEEWKILWSS